LQAEISLFSAGELLSINGNTLQGGSQPKKRSRRRYSKQTGGKRGLTSRRIIGAIIHLVKDNPQGVELHPDEIALMLKNPDGSHVSKRTVERYWLDCLKSASKIGSLTLSKLHFKSRIATPAKNPTRSTHVRSLNNKPTWVARVSVPFEESPRQNAVYMPTVLKDSFKVKDRSSTRQAAGRFRTPPESLKRLGWLIAREGKDEIISFRLLRLSGAAFIAAVLLAEGHSKKRIRTELCRAERDARELLPNNPIAYSLRSIRERVGEGHPERFRTPTQHDPELLRKVIESLNQTS